MAPQSYLRMACGITFMLTLSGGGIGSVRAGVNNCICTTEYDPVCGTDGMTYSNRCFAECKLGKGRYKLGRCEKDAFKPIAGCIGVARCAADACEQPWPSECQNSPPEDAVCFNNPCVGVVYHGEELLPCEPIWVDPKTNQLVQCGDGPKPADCICPQIYDPVCGADGKIYPNSCVAACEMGPGKRYDEGACEEINSFIKCSPQNAVQCFADPCSINDCPAHPSATCLPNYCNNAVYRGQRVGACEALYVDAEGNPVDCYEGLADDILACDPDAPLCIEPDPCPSPTCPGAPRAACISKFCTLTYRGTELAACAPVWYDRLTGDLLEGCTPAA